MNVAIFLVSLWFWIACFPAAASQPTRSAVTAPAAAPETAASLLSSETKERAALDREMARAAELRSAGQPRRAARLLHALAESHRDDPDALRSIAFSGTGVMPDAAYWSTVWHHVRFTRGTRSTLLDVQFPDAGRRPHFTGTPITLEAEKIDVLDLLRVLQSIGGASFTQRDDLSLVGLSITLDVTDMPWDELLQRIAECHGISATSDGASIHLAPVSSQAHG